MVVPDINDRLEDPDKVREIYGVLSEEDYNLQSYRSALDKIGEVLSDEPDYSTPMLLKQAAESLADAQKEIKEDNTDLSYVISVLESEIDSYPAIGVGRHYNLEKRRKNL